MFGCVWLRNVGVLYANMCDLNRVWAAATAQNNYMAAIRKYFCTSKKILYCDITLEKTSTNVEKNILAKLNFYDAHINTTNSDKLLYNNDPRWFCTN